MREETIYQISDDLLIIPPVIGKSVTNMLWKNVFSAIKEDISAPHFGIMKILNDSGEMHISQVADALQIPRPQMTLMVDRLEELGYVQRETDASDRRSIIIKLTRKGKNTFHDWAQTVREGTNAMLDFLSDDELKDFADSLAKLRDLVIKIYRNHYVEVKE
jgi:DNA-binding MarR family transcriptional regulator